MSTAFKENKPSLLVEFGKRYTIEPNRVANVLKNTAFRDVAHKITDDQMIALLVVANQYGLNPFTREIYAFPKAGTITPVVGVDGWVTLMNSTNKDDGVEFRESETTVTAADGTVCCEWIECLIYKKGSNHPTIVRERFLENYQQPFTNKDGKEIKGPWQTCPYRMLRHRALAQAVRVAFGFSGIYDIYDAKIIAEAEAKKETTAAATQYTVYDNNDNGEVASENKKTSFVKQVISSNDNDDGAVYV